MVKSPHNQRVVQIEGFRLLVILLHGYGGKAMIQGDPGCAHFNYEEQVNHSIFIEKVKRLFLISVVFSIRVWTEEERFILRCFLESDECPNRSNMKVKKTKVIRRRLELGNTYVWRMG